MPNKSITLPTQIDLEAFISDQAHDLRTPFNHIIGFSKMTLNTIGDAPLTAFQKDDLGTIYRSGLHALTYMNGLIDVARLNRGDKELNPSRVNLQTCLEQAIAQWKKFNPGESTVDYALNMAEPSLTSDDQVLRQILTGFITFVACYCEGKASFEVMVEEDDGRVLFTITSAGTRPRQLPDLDWQLSGFVCRAFVELLKGEITKAEETDAGALVQFALTKI